MVDTHRLAEQLELLYASVLDISSLGTFNQRLAEATDSHITGVLIHDVTAGRAGISHIHGVNNTLMGELLTQLDLRDDPWMQKAMPQLASGRLLDSDDLLPRREALDSGFFNDYYRQLGIVQQVVSVGMYDGSNSVTLTMCHGDSERVYGEAELGLLRALTPHWINAYAIMRRIGHLESDVSTLEQALERSPVAMFMLGDDLRVQRVNAAAEHLLSTGVLKRAGGRLFKDGHGGIELQGLLHRALRGSSRLQEGDVEKVVLRGADGVPCLTLTAHRLVRWSPQEIGTLLVFVREVRRAPTSLQAAMQGLFGLTVAEARLALALYRHVDSSLAAKECGITSGSALSRLKTIYHKTGERSQASLVRLMAAVAAASG